ncbi:unnamed protein product [Caenorhabditis sp. 36 PRJEB53466]|nr:unnamed protein product [Caenorhabditis sp. 36 PRJEB53466]
MSSTVLAQIIDELGTNLASDRELHLLKSAHRIIEKNLSINTLTDRNDVYHRHVHRLMSITFVSLEKSNADVRLAAESYYEHILKTYECLGFPETSLKLVAMSIERMNGARQSTKMMKYLVYYLDVLPKQRTLEKSGRTFHQEVIRTLILRSLEINQTICHQSLEKSCDRLVSGVVWHGSDLREIADKTYHKLWVTKGHASRTMAALLGAVMLESKDIFQTMFNNHLDKVIDSFVNNQTIPVGSISLIRKCLAEYVNDIPIDSLKALVEMLLLMIRDSSNEIAYDAFAALEELMRVGPAKLDGFTPENYLKSTYGDNTPEPEEKNETAEFVDPLVNADLYEQMQETKPPQKVDLTLEHFDRIAVGSTRSVENYVAAFLGKTFLLTGIGTLLKTDRQSKDSMKILAIRVLNVLCLRLHLEKFVVRIGDKTQCLVDIVEFSISSDDQLAQQAIKFAFIVLETGFIIENCLFIFKSVKKYRYLLDAYTSNHIKHLHNTDIHEFLEIMAFRSLLTTHYDLSLPEVISASRFMNVVREWVETNQERDGKRWKAVERFQDCLKRCIIDYWDTPRFISTVPSLVGTSSEPSEDAYPPSIPLQINNLTRKRVENKKKANNLGSAIYDDWRTLLLSEALMPTFVKISSILENNNNNTVFCHEKLPMLSKMHWNSDTVPALLQVMTTALTDSPSKDDCYHGFHVGMSVLNWIYRNVFIVRGAAETKEFSFLQHSRVEMDDALGNRTEFRATLDAFYRTIQSSADEKLEQLLTPTVDLVMSVLENNFRLTTENVLEIIVYIRVLFTLSPVNALKLLHILLRSLLDPKLVEALTKGRVFYFESQKSGKNLNSNDDVLISALKCTGDRYFNRWGDDVDIEKVKSGAMTFEILTQLEPLITQSLKTFRYRGKREKEQVLQIMICLMNHKLKLSDADPTQCLMKFAVQTFGKPEECAHPELFDTLMHFLATATRFQIDEEYETPIHAATSMMKSVKKLPKEHVRFVMKAVSFAVMNGRFEISETEELLETDHATWMICMEHAPTETLYTLSLLLEKTKETVNNQQLFWSIYSAWISTDHPNAAQVPFSAMALPLSLITEYLTSDAVQVIKIIDGWVKEPTAGNIHAKCALIAVLNFRNTGETDQEQWKRYFEYIKTHGMHTKTAEIIWKHVNQSLLPIGEEEDAFDEELADSDGSDALAGLLSKHYCGSYQDLCHIIVCLGDEAVFEFIDICEAEQPNDDTLWALLVAEFRRLDDDLEHRLDISFRLQELAETLADRFNANVYLKLLAHIENSNINLACLDITQVQLLLDQVTPECSENGYVLRGVRTLLGHPRMLQLISDDELETAKLFVKLAEKVTGIEVTDALLATYHQYRVDFHVKGEMNEKRVKEIKKFTFAMFVLCQEANLRSRKGLTKTQSACFRHPILNSLFNIPLVAMKCFNWIPVVEILRKPTITCLPPTGHICEGIVLDDLRSRLAKVGLVTNAQFEVLFTTMQAVIAHTVIGPEKLDHDSKDVLERESKSCKALQLYIATILTSMKYPNGGDPSSGFVLKSPYISELFLQSSEFAHLCNLKSVWKCEPRTAFTTPLERHNPKTWTKFDGQTTLYGICQTPLFSLWQLCGMMPIEFKQHANYHRIDHSASNYFLTSATNIDTISNVKQLMNIFEYWYSQGIGELSESLLHAILHTILHLSDFFDDPDLHRAVLRTTCIIYRHEYDQNPFLSSFVLVMFLKSISVLGADAHGPEFKQGEPEHISLKLVSTGLASSTKIMRLHTLAGLLYLVQSDSYESFAPAIDVLSRFLEKYLRRLANGSVRIQSDESQFVIALLIKLLEVPIRLKQDKKTLLKLLLASMRVRRERFIVELIAEGIEQLLCRSNEFNGDVTNFMLAGIESGDPSPFPTDNEYYCRAAYRILMVAATRAKVANDVSSMTRIYKALQKLGFDMLSRGETAPAITRTLPFFSICVNGVDQTIVRYVETFMLNGNDKDTRFIVTLINQVVETATTSKKWSIELKTFRERLEAKKELLDEHEKWLLEIFNKKMTD